MQIFEADAIVAAHVAAHVYRPEVSIHRDAQRELESIFDKDSAPAILAHGPIGSGKTTWACQIAEQRAREGKEVIFLSVSDLDREDDPVARDVVKALRERARRSPDGRVVVLVDDAAGRPGNDGAFRAVIRIANVAASDPSIRMLFSIRTDVLTRFFDRNPGVLPAQRFREVPIEPFHAYELEALAERLSVVSNDSPAIADARVKAATALADSSDAASLIPALAMSFLESIRTAPVSGDVTRFKVYSRLFAGRVLGSADNLSGIRRSRMLKGLASTLMGRSDLSLPIDSPDAPPLDVMEECETLIADRVLERRVEDFGVRLAFVDDDFCAFMAAIAIDGSFTEALADLLRRGEEFPPARRVAAFFVARVIAHGVSDAEKVYAILGDERLDLLHMVGEFDSDTFLALLPLLARSSVADALHLLSELLSAGFPRLARRGAELLEPIVPRERVREVQWLLSKAFVAVDDLVSARRTLETIAEPPEAEVLYLLGEVEIARGRLDEAEKWYRAILDLTDISDANRANALHGLGDVIGTRGRMREAKDEAIAKIQQAIELYPKDPLTKDLAEAWGDLAEFLGEAGRTGEARRALDESHRINDELPAFYPGLMIVEGLRGFVDFLDGDFVNAEQHLKRCREAVRKLGFRWRTAWCDSKLALVAEALGDSEEGKRLRERADATFAALAGPVEPKEIVH